MLTTKSENNSDTAKQTKLPKIEIFLIFKIINYVVDKINQKYFLNR